MQFVIANSYKRKDIKGLLKTCPLCAGSNCAYWSQITNQGLNVGKEGLECHNCQLKLAFKFKVDLYGEIIDEYKLDYLRIGNLEFKNYKGTLAFYNNNTFVRDLPDKILDIEKYKKWLLLT